METLTFKLNGDKKEVYVGNKHVRTLTTNKPKTPTAEGSYVQRNKDESSESCASNTSDSEDSLSDETSSSSSSDSETSVRSDSETNKPPTTTTQPTPTDKPQAKKFNCVKCGRVFPYRMALNGHNKKGCGDNKKHALPPDKPQKPSGTLHKQNIVKSEDKRQKRLRDIGV